MQFLVDFARSSKIAPFIPIVAEQIEGGPCDNLCLTRKVARSNLQKHPPCLPHQFRNLRRKYPPNGHGITAR